MSDDEITGPFPPGADPDEYDRRRRRAMWSMSSGLYLLGSRSGDECNLMTINWVTQIASRPKLIGVSVEVEALTHRLVSEGEAFSVCVLHRRDRALVRKFVRPADHDAAAGTLGGVEVITAQTGAPIFAGSAAWMDCRVEYQVDAGTHTFFIGEVVDAAAPTEADIEILRMEDTKMNYGG